MVNGIFRPQGSPARMFGNSLPGTSCGGRRSTDTNMRERHVLEARRGRMIAGAGVEP